MENNSTYDVAITGGGLAGLALAIQLGRKGHRVVLFEKEKFPFHKVCGEYISLESWDFLENLGVGLSSLDLPIIKTLEVSDTNGRRVTQELPLGGFGISRYLLDHRLVMLAKAAGVTVLEETRVNNIVFENDQFILEAGGAYYTAAIAVGSFGKRSNLDVKWKRPFVSQPKNKLNNYLGIKYHIRTDQPVDTIALHFFRGGYCGIVKIEEQKYCLCYLTTADTLNAYSSIDELEAKGLSQNPYLKKIVDTAEKLYPEPLTISQVSFDTKSPVHEHVLMLGDAAGMITPLCGNGMSIALHSSKIAASVIHLYLRNKWSRAKLENNYSRQWHREFASRLRTGRMIQRWVNQQRTRSLFMQLAKSWPSLFRWLIRRTHGRAF